MVVGQILLKIHVVDIAVVACALEHNVLLLRIFRVQMSDISTLIEQVNVLFIILFFEGEIAAIIGC